MRLYDNTQKFFIIKLALIFFLIAGMSGLTAQESSDSERSATSGLDLLPSDLRNRWITLNEQADSATAIEYIEEGNLVIRQLETLVNVVGGKPPKPHDPSYAVYMSILNRMIKLLDTIELASVLNMADDMYLENLLDDYHDEKMQLADDLRSDRQALIEQGSNRIREHLQDPAFRKDPLRREIIADLYFRIAELNYQETEDKFGEQLEEYTNRLNELMETNPSAISQLKEPYKDNRRVLSLYQKIVDEYADTKYGVDALYNVATLTAESDNPRDKATANQYFETLIELYPGNEYTLNALRRIGDYYFNPPINNIEKAVRVYERISREFSASTRYTEALYMLGWCHYRMSDLPTAVEYFARVLDGGYDDDGNAIDERYVKKAAIKTVKKTKKKVVKKKTKKKVAKKKKKAPKK